MALEEKEKRSLYTNITTIIVLKKKKKRKNMKAVCNIFIFNLTQPQEKKLLSAWFAKFFTNLKFF